MHGTEAKPSWRAAARRDSPSITILSWPIRRGMLNPSAPIEFAISRMCAASDLRSRREWDPKASIRYA